MLKIVDLVYDSYESISDPEQVINKQVNTLAYIPFLSTRSGYHVIRHLNYSGSFTRDNADFIFFKRKNNPWSIPLKTHRYIRKLSPDIILIQGMIFPLQAIAIKIFTGKRTKIIMQHHGETPVFSVRKFFQHIADYLTDGYLFSCFENSLPWINTNVIRDPKKIHVIPAASIRVDRLDKTASRNRLGLPVSKKIFLWVGRLEKNKDPLTVVKAFKLHLSAFPGSLFYMIYQAAPMIAEVHEFITQNLLQDSIILKGEVEHKNLSIWYSSSDFYVSGSNTEACGYSLIEAMHCGCIPLVTRIPSFNQVTKSGRYAYLYTPKDFNELSRIMNEVVNSELSGFSDEIECFAKTYLCPENTAERLLNICMKVNTKKR